MVAFRFSPREARNHKAAAGVGEWAIELSPELARDGRLLLN
ncbi:hypothetical protein [Microcoleus sp. D2_18a_D3]